MLEAIYNKQLEDMNLQVNTTLLNENVETKIIEIIDHKITNINVTEIRNNIKKQINNKKKKYNTNYNE
jgi:predicted SprT family Zn-dependent metalloprotease